MTAPISRFGSLTYAPKKTAITKSATVPIKSPNDSDTLIKKLQTASYNASNAKTLTNSKEDSEIKDNLEKAAVDIARAGFGFLTGISDYYRRSTEIVANRIELAISEEGMDDNKFTKTQSIDNAEEVIQSFTQNAYKEIEEIKKYLESAEANCN